MGRMSDRRAPMGLVGLVGSTIIAGTLLAGSAGPVLGAGSGCRVVNLDNGVARATLQGAVTHARAGQRLQVQGTCHGLTTVGKTLTISGLRTRQRGAPVLDGDALGSVLSISSGVTVTIRTLTIRDGASDNGGGIYSTGTLTLDRVTVRASTAVVGGGVYGGGPTTIVDSTIKGNTASNAGGGLYNAGGAWTMAIKGASLVLANGSDYGGGLYNNGTAVVRGTTLFSENQSTSSGGAIFNGLNLTLAGQAQLHANTAATLGGGVHTNGTLTMKDSATIIGNGASDGGGVYGSGRVGVKCGTNVRLNTPDDCSP